MVLGPPNSGKTIFSYVLCEELRRLGDDAAIVECDYFSPSLHKLVGALKPYQSLVPYKEKKPDLNPDYCRNAVWGALKFVNQRGIIVLNGVGKHTETTDEILEFADGIIIICTGEILNNSQLTDYGFVDYHTSLPLHPFCFYENLSHSRGKDLLCCVTTFRVTDPSKYESAYFNESERKALIYNLEREEIRDGDYSGLYFPSIEVVNEIARWLLSLNNNH